MKAELIEKIIMAHKAGSETAFGIAVENLAVDEEKKGNIRLSKLIRDAYVGKNSNSTLIKSSKKTGQSLGYISPSSAHSAPRDKESKLELYDVVYPTVELKDVVLPGNQSELLKQVLAETAKNDELIAKNLPPANRLLLCGPPGCGKTMTAHAIAHELGLPLAYVRLDGLVSSYLGQTSVNLRKVFDSISGLRLVLFLDEFDAIAKKRDDSNEMGELKRVVTALLQNFDSLPPTVFIIAATNHEHLLDPAIWRRFNYILKLDLPKMEQRRELIRKWFDDYQIDHKVSLGKLAQITQGMSPAAIKELIISAAKRQVTHGVTITTEDIIRLLLQQLTNNADEASEIDAVVMLKERGVSERQLSKALGIAHSTLNYRLSKAKDGDAENGQ
jgi:SpoVK/Ycf46/Vps4 family AAA+-type ATPase